MNRIALLSVAAAAALSICGCTHTVTAPDGSTVTMNGDHVTSVQTDKGRMDVDKNGSYVVKTDQGTAQFDAQSKTYTAQDSKGNTTQIGGAVTEGELGVPFYPGSTDTGASMKSMKDGKSMAMATRKTGDDPAKVLEFYTSKLGKPDQTMSSGSLATGEWKLADKSITVMATGANGSTTIQVSSTTK